jgi:hypothetical protein
MKEIKIKTPYGVKNWSYIKRLFDMDTKGRTVKITVKGGVAEVMERPLDVDVIIKDVENCRKYRRRKQKLFKKGILIFPAAGHLSGLMPKKIRCGG